MAITQKFENGLIKASEEFKKWKKRGNNYFNIFDALGVGRKENYHSAFIRYLLDKDDEHYQSVFAEQFLEKLKNEIPNLNFSKLSVENLIEIRTEASTKKSRQNRRMDILLTFTNDIHIIIENKIGAKDQSAQIKAYVEEIYKRKSKLSDKQKYQTTLVIYLHPDKIDPSEMSFGKTSARKQKYWYLDKDGQYSVIRDENDKIKAYYFQMDYKWIKCWIKSCIKELEKQAKSRVRGDLKTRGENGLDKIIFGLKQYVEVLEWRVTDEREDSDSVVEFITKDNKNQQMALEIMKNPKHNLHEIVKNSWNSISERVVENFYNELLKTFEKGVKIDKDIWKAYRTDDELGKTGWQMVFYKKSREELNFDYVMAFGLAASKFEKFYFAYGHLYYYNTKDEQKRYEKMMAECSEFFKPNNKNGIKKDGDCYYEFLSNDSKEYTFAEWIIEKGEKAVAEFETKFTEFIKNLETIKNAKQENIMQEIEKYIDKNL